MTSHHNLNADLWEAVFTWVNFNKEAQRKHFAGLRTKTSRDHSFELKPKYHNLSPILTFNISNPIKLRVKDEKVK